MEVLWDGLPEVSGQWLATDGIPSGDSSSFTPLLRALSAQAALTVTSHWWLGGGILRDHVNRLCEWLPGEGRRSMSPAPTTFKLFKWFDSVTVLRHSSFHTFVQR